MRNGRSHSSGRIGHHTQTVLANRIACKNAAATHAVKIFNVFFFENLIWREPHYIRKDSKNRKCCLLVLNNKWRRKFEIFFQFANNKDWTMLHLTTSFTFFVQIFASFQTSQALNCFRGNDEVRWLECLQQLLSFSTSNMTRVNLPVPDPSSSTAFVVLLSSNRSFFKKNFTASIG